MSILDLVSKGTEAPVAISYDDYEIGTPDAGMVGGSRRFLHVGRNKPRPFVFVDTSLTQFCYEASAAVSNGADYALFRDTLHQLFLSNPIV